MKTVRATIVTNPTGKIGVVLPTEDLDTMLAGLLNTTPEELLTFPVDIPYLSVKLPAFKTDGLRDLLLLNEVLRYIKYEDAKAGIDPDADSDLWGAYVALLESTKFDLKETFDLLVAGSGFEFFPGVLTMREVAKYMVKEGRLFGGLQFPATVRAFFDYDKIGENLLTTGNFYVTSTGIVFISRDIKALD